MVERVLAYPRAVAASQRIKQRIKMHLTAMVDQDLAQPQTAGSDS
jgi:hypothetical protein